MNGTRSWGRWLLVAAGMAAVAGCVQSPLRNYVGMDVREVKVDYGEPAGAFDLPGGLRAFQWVVNSSYTTPTHISTTRTLRDKKDPDSWINRRTTIEGGEHIQSSCLYTLFARWDEGIKGWRVSGEREPRVSCQQQ